MKEALVCSYAASIHKENHYDSTVIDEVLHGMKVSILNMEGCWYFVRTHYRYEGYIHKSKLFMAENFLQQWDLGPHSMIIGRFADVLDCPKYQGVRILCLTRGAQIVSGSADKDGWTQILTAAGECGYIRSSFLSCAPKSLYLDEYAEKKQKNPKLTAKNYIEKNLGITEEVFRMQVVATAKQYLGTQYRWGGKSTYGIDCSGLCSMAYMLNGINIFRDASIKEDFPVQQIARENIKEGDLLYFPGHIAMYLGNGRYIHSTGRAGSDGVVINSLNPKDADYREDLASAIKQIGSIFVG